MDLSLHLSHFIGEFGEHGLHRLLLLLHQGYLVLILRVLILRLVVVQVLVTAILLERLGLPGRETTLTIVLGLFLNRVLMMLSIVRLGLLVEIGVVVARRLQVLWILMVSKFGLVTLVARLRVATLLSSVKMVSNLMSWGRYDQLWCLLRVEEVRLL